MFQGLEQGHHTTHVETVPREYVVTICARNGGFLDGNAKISVPVYVNHTTEPDLETK